MIRTIKPLTIALCVLLSVVKIQAADGGLGGASYFLVTEAPSQGEMFGPGPGGRTFDPLPLRETQSIHLNIMRWVRFATAPPQPTVKYHRELHYGKWQNQSGSRCRNTRALVLERESRGPVTYSEGDCSVASGLWHDPFTNLILRQATDVQIDHMVPVKTSYVSGGFAWSWPVRCAYFNYMGNRIHLIPVHGPENSNKGDRGPESYLPPNPAYKCEYMANWLKIKLIWRLMISEEEARALSVSVRQLGCDSRLFEIRTSDLQQQRRLIQQSALACPPNPPPVREMELN